LASIPRCRTRPGSETTGWAARTTTPLTARSVTSRKVYADDDPLVLSHARALLVSAPQGATDYIHADLREPDKILQGAARTLDFAEPAALMR